MRLPSYPWRFAHLAALWAYGVGQPVFSMLDGNPEFLVVRGSTRVEAVAFALILSIVPPLGVIAVEALASLISRTLARVLHIVAIWCFTFLTGLQLVRVLDSTRLSAFVLVPSALASVGMLAYLRWSAFRSFLSVSLALPVIGLAAFVATVPLAIDDREGARVSVPTRTPVVLVVLDELPVSSLLDASGDIDERRYPSFARLARDGTWYPLATTVHEHTTQAVPAILTGRLPQVGQLPTLADHPDNLFTLLGESYGFRVRELLTRLCPTRYCPERRADRPLEDRLRGLAYDVGVGYLHQVLPPSVRGDLPPIGDKWGGFGEEADADARDRLLGAIDARDVDRAVENRDERPRAQFTRFVRSIAPSPSGRTLDMVHLLLPHSPWRFLPSGREYGNSALIGGTRDGWNQWGESAWPVEHGLQRHLLQVGYTDRLIGKLLDRLDRTGLYDAALLIVTADHGASFRPGGWRRLVTKENLADIAGVPLFVKYPGQRRGRVDRRDARTIDILPTIADVIGTRLPWKVDGQSLRGPSTPRDRVSVARRAGGTVEAPVRKVAAGVLRTARRNASLFGEGSDPPPRRNGSAGLLGEDVAELPREAARDSDVQIEGESLLLDVDTRSAFLPVHVVGQINDDALPSPTDLAITVNGRIAAVARTFDMDGRSRFAALVPENTLRDGRNHVEVYAVLKGQRTRLMRLGGTAPAARYSLVDGGRAIVLANGRTAAVDPDRLAGRVDSWVDDGETVRIVGWAADVRAGVLPDRVLVFSGSRLVYEGTTDLLRWDVAETKGNAVLERSGWIAELPSRAVERSQVRAFALRGSAASELEWSIPKRRLPAGAGQATRAVPRSR